MPDQLKLLEIELYLIKENIKRVRKYQKDKQNQKWKPSHSNVLGELKHRLIAFKQRATLVSKISTSDLFRNK